MLYVYIKHFKREKCFACLLECKNQRTFFGNFILSYINRMWQYNFLFQGKEFKKEIAARD